MLSVCSWKLRSLGIPHFPLLLIHQGEFCSDYPNERKMTSQGYRALHYVLKIGDRKSAINFFKDVLGMKVLRHEEFEKGCEATCNGPYDGKWSKTMIGYGPEDNHFVLELTYNYGISSYRHGDALDSIEIEKKDVSLVQAHAETKEVDGSFYLRNNGFRFRVFPSSTVDRITRVNLLAGAKEAVNENHVKFYESVLGMKLLNSGNSNETILSYGEDQATISLKTLMNQVDHGTAFGRTAFACPTSLLPKIENKVSTAVFNDVKPKILTPLISLDTPGKATVSVVIVGDLTGHEICFVGDEGFRELSKVDPNADSELIKRIEEDKSNEWFEKHGKSKEESK